LTRITLWDIKLPPPPYFYFPKENLFILDGVSLIVGDGLQMDVAAFIIGLIVGVITIGIAIEIGMRRVNKNQPTTRPTHKWSIEEIANPRIIAENMGVLELPKNAKIVVNEYENGAILKGVEVKQHPGIRGNFILGDDRALILSGPIKQDELGIWTVEKEMLEKLNRYFNDSWEKATPLLDDEPDAQRLR
jgi:hypothetical protein